MKKLGFTLTEILITMSIVGIVAAISLPALNRAIPDSNKAKVLKAYNTITNINQKLLNDPRLYPGEADCDVHVNGFRCVGVPIEWRNLVTERYHNNALDGAITNNAFRNMRKYINLFAMNLEISNIPISRNLFANSTNAANFFTEDGLQWFFLTEPHLGATISYTITIDTKTTDDDCTYDTCTSPEKADRFRFLVDQFGQVTGDDPLTKAYLANPNKLNSKTEDFAKAKEFAN